MLHMLCSMLAQHIRNNWTSVPATWIW